MSSWLSAKQCKFHPEEVNIMNKQHYSFGNPLKVKFRDHYCYKCGTKLSIVEHHKVVNQKSEEAKYYDFSIGVDGGVMVGSCEFIHKVFFCTKCSENIEFVTQINQEDIDIIINKVERYFNNKGKKIVISKHYEIKDGVFENKISKIDLVKSLCLIIEENDKATSYNEIPVSKKSSWERPYYFKLTKKQLIKFIRRNSDKMDIKM